VGWSPVAAGQGAKPPTDDQSARSDEAATEQRLSEARSKYEAGVKAYERGRYKDAVDWFLAADRLAPSAPLSFNVARAYERLGDDSSALRWYRDYLRRDANAPNAPSVRKIVADLAAALAKKGVQQVTVLSVPAGATVAVDGQPSGVTPCTFDLPPGKHHLFLSYRGYADHAREIELGAAEPVDVSIALDRAAGADRPAPLPAPVAVAPAPATSAAPGHEAKAKGRRFGVWPWVTAGAGAVALGGALTFELMRRSAEDDAESEPTQLGFQSAIDTMENRKNTARVLLGVGGALVATGVVLWLVDANSERPVGSVALSCSPERCGLHAKGAF
jgi:tetratricopeptide (TPR) repeat protein